jgi:hypothetical protein
MSKKKFLDLYAIIAPNATATTVEAESLGGAYGTARN